MFSRRRCPYISAAPAIRLSILSASRFSLQPNLVESILRERRFWLFKSWDGPEVGQQLKVIVILDKSS